LDAAIAQNQADLESAGHWGVPTMVFEGEPFFGQDRIDLLVWRMKQHGLRERAGDARTARGAGGD
jgi:2-hydroxychromene-2-carboxylate isomerase